MQGRDKKRKAFSLPQIANIDKLVLSVATKSKGYKARAYFDRHTKKAYLCSIFVS